MNEFYAEQYSNVNSKLNSKFFMRNHIGIR
jgi:hypothetical protein